MGLRSKPEKFDPTREFVATRRLFTGKRHLVAGDRLERGELRDRVLAISYSQGRVAMLPAAAGSAKKPAPVFAGWSPDWNPFRARDVGDLIVMLDWIAVARPKLAAYINDSYAGAVERFSARAAAEIVAETSDQAGEPDGDVASPASPPPGAPVESEPASPQATALPAGWRDMHGQRLRALAAKLTGSEPANKADAIAVLEELERSGAAA